MIRTLSRVYWPCYLLAQLLLARWVRVDFYDALVNLRNASALSGAALDYTTYRPPLLPLLHVPLQVFLRLIGAGPNALLWAPHLFEVFLSLAALGAVYLFLESFLPEEWAQAGAILFSLDRLVAHYFFAVMSDLPAMGLLLAFFSLAEKGRSKLAAAALAGCCACRWNMLVVPLGMMAALPFVKEKHRREELLVMTAWALGLFLALNALAYFVALGIGPVKSARLVVHTMRSQLRQNSGREWPWAYFASLFTSAGPALFAFFAAGAAFARLDSRRDILAQAGYFAAFFAVMTLAVGHKESRYLIPALPAFYLVALYGLKSVYEKTKQKALLAAVAAVAVLGGGRELARFFDPALRDPVMFDTARAVLANRAQGADVYWYGFTRSVVPRDPVFTLSDPYYYLYHVPSPESVEYLTGLKVRSLEKQTQPKPGDLVVRAPVRPWLLARPLPPEENRLWIWRVEPGRKLALVGQ